MLKKALTLFISSVFLLTLGACGTMKGACEGAKKDWAGVQSAWGKLKEIDAQMQKTLW